MAKSLKNITIGSEIEYMVEGRRGRPSIGIVVGKSPRKISVFRPNLNTAEKIKPSDVIRMAQDKAKRAYGPRKPKEA